MSELLNRITSESPSFFKKIQTIGLTLSAIGTAIVAIPVSIIALPAVVTTIAGYFIAIGMVAAAVAKTTVADTTVLNK